MVAQVCRRLHHPPRGARGADSPAFAGEGYKVVVPTVAAASAGKISAHNGMPDIRSLRIPLRYLANLLTAGKETPVAEALFAILARLSPIAITAWATVVALIWSRRLDGRRRAIRGCRRLCRSHS